MFKTCCGAYLATHLLEVIFFNSLNVIVYSMRIQAVRRGLGFLPFYQRFVASWDIELGPLKFSSDRDTLALILDLPAKIK